MKIAISKPKLHSVATKSALVIISLVIAVSAPMQMVNQVEASPQTDALQAQIDAIKQDISQYSAESTRLSNEAQTLQSAIDKLVNEKAIIQAQLDISQKTYDQLVIKIAETEQQIVNNKDALGATIANMYVDGNVTPIEMLASSSSISDYMDKQEYQASIRDQLTATIKTINDLKVQLNKQKSDQEKILADQKAERDDLAQKTSQQQYLLDQTQGQEAAYQKLIAQKTVDLKDKQAQIDYFNSLTSTNVSAGDPSKGGYPSYLANSAQDSTPDPWGMYNRECVSYASWKVYQAYGSMPYWGGRGNAWQWAFSGNASTSWSNYGARVWYDSGWYHTANTVTSNIPQGTEPKAGSVAIMAATPNNPWGHAAWVEAILPNNMIKISQYNWYVASLGGWGQYSEMIVSKDIFQSYIYFGDWK